MTLSAEQAEKIGKELDIFAIVHYVLAGITALFGFLPVVHLAMGVAMLTGVFPAPASGPNPNMFIGGLFTGVALMIMVMFWVTAAVTAYAGLSLRRRRNYVFIFVIAVLNCMGQPLSMMLGVLTIVWLLKDDVRALFDDPYAEFD